MKTMKAIGFETSLPIDQEDSLVQFNAEYPFVGPKDVLVKVNAVSVNPADAKVRIRTSQNSYLNKPVILGYDAVGTIIEVGDSTEDFQVGDRVYYAGDANRSGSNAEFQVVDSRIIAKAPESITNAEAAALPLTGLTAWEALFDRLRVPTADSEKTILIIGGAGGVGSMATQLLKAETKLKVISTASRTESREWSLSQGADCVADHRNLTESVRECGVKYVDYILNTADTYMHWDAMAELIAPQGQICSIVEYDGVVDLNKLQSKSAGFVWELMFTRSNYGTSDMAKQGQILQTIAQLIDSKKIVSTCTKVIQGFNVESLREAHKLIESGKTIGKISIDY